jgi:catechol 2,3-dioxygenase-like lactoylglutathione lyase family enzyme
MRKLLKAYHPAMQRGRINASILLNIAQCAKSDRLLDFKEPSGHFAPVRVNATLTLLFSEDTSFDSHHYAFHVTDAEFDAILGRIKKAGLAYGSAPWSLDDGKINDWGGGRGVYFEDPNGHVLELMTVPQ